MIKVYIDQMPLKAGHAVRGIGTYTRNLVDALKKSRKIGLVDKPEKADIIHYPYFDLFFKTLKVGSGRKVIVTIFDTIPLVYPEQYPPGVKGQINLLVQKAQLRKASTVITISETSRKDIVRFLGVPQENVFPIRLAPAGHFRLLPNNSTTLRSVVEKYGLPDDFVLYVGDVNYNKNLLGLAEACSLAKLPLVIVGKQAADDEIDKRHFESRPFASFLEKYGGDKNIMRLGFVSDEDLVAIYNLATVYCQPSFYEGFGLSVLEAQASGCPVVASRTQALVEIAEGSVLFVDPKDPRDIANGLLKVARDNVFAKGLVKRGFENVRRFSWSEVADETIAVYKKVLE